MSLTAPPLPLFAGLGLELEYMIVDAQSLSVLPVADQVLREDNGDYASHAERGEMGWSNELALHVLELKTKGPALTLAGLPEKIQSDVAQINRHLEPLGGCLMPTAMHPWMDPQRETRLWPHDYHPVYQAFDRIFGCQGHGWSNLQSLHLNLPFADDREFARLHAAIRLLLPLLPALAASSPIQDGAATGWLDNRLKVYSANCAKIPSITGLVVPEPVFTRHDYDTRILQRIYQDIAPSDPEGILQEEWLNARGAIARFERNTVEIRVLDVQETPDADLAIAATVVAVLRAMVEERWTDLACQQFFSTEALHAILEATMQNAEAAIITDAAFLRAFGVNGLSMSAGDLWRQLIAQVLPDTSPASFPWRPSLEVILNQGCLARRILYAVGPTPSRECLHEVYQELCHCLVSRTMFT